MNVQQTLVVLKPDATKRRLIGRIIDRFEQKGLRLAGMKMLQLTPERAADMYAVHKGEYFYDRLIEFTLSGPVVAIVLAGPEAIEVVRAMMGPTLSREAPAGTIRGDFALSRRLNLVHGSDSAESAAREIPIFFDAAEIFNDTGGAETWMWAD